MLHFTKLKSHFNKLRTKLWDSNKIRFQFQHWSSNFPKLHQDNLFRNQIIIPPGPSIDPQSDPGKGRGCLCVTAHSHHWYHHHRRGNHVLVTPPSPRASVQPDGSERWATSLARPLPSTPHPQRASDPAPPGVIDQSADRTTSELTDRPAVSNTSDRRGRGD